MWPGAPFPPIPTPHPHISDRLSLFLSPRATRWRRAPRADSWRLRHWLVGGEPRDARRHPLRPPAPGVSPPRAPAPPRRTRCCAQGSRQLSRPGRWRLAGLLEASRLAGPGSGVGGAQCPSRERAPGGVLLGGRGASRVVCSGLRVLGPPTEGGGRQCREFCPRSAFRVREDPGRDAAATVLVSPRRPSGGSDARGRCSRCWC